MVLNGTEKHFSGLIPADISVEVMTFFEVEKPQN
jgi:hypothetical protein